MMSAIYCVTVSHIVWLNEKRMETPNFLRGSLKVLKASESELDSSHSAKLNCVFKQRRVSEEMAVSSTHTHTHDQVNRSDSQAP